MKKIIFIIIFIIIFNKDTYASDYISQGLDSLNIKQYDTIINNNIYNSDFKFSSLIEEA